MRTLAGLARDAEPSLVTAQGDADLPVYHATFSPLFYNGTAVAAAAARMCSGGAGQARFAARCGRLTARVSCESMT